LINVVQNTNHLTFLISVINSSELVIQQQDIYSVWLGVPNTCWDKPGI